MLAVYSGNHILAGGAPLARQYQGDSTSQVGTRAEFSMVHLLAGHEDKTQRVNMHSFFGLPSCSDYGRLRPWRYLYTKKTGNLH